MKSTSKTGSMTQPLGAETARVLIVAWLVFMETSFRQKSEGLYLYDIIMIQMSSGVWSVGSGGSEVL